MGKPEDSESIAIVLFDGFDELDAIGPYEVLSLAAGQGANLSVELVTLESRTQVEANNGLKVIPDGTLTDNADTIIVPGGGWNSRAEQSAWAEVQKGDLPKAIAEYHYSGKTIAGVCTGGMIMAAGEFLENRPAITHHGAIEDLREYGVTVVDARVVDDGDVITAGGVTSGLDLALWLVERMAGQDLANDVAGILEYERRGKIHQS